MAAAKFGGHVIGTDIDFLMLHGRTRPTRKQTRVICLKIYVYKTSLNCIYAKAIFVLLTLLKGLC